MNWNRKLLVAIGLIALIGILVATYDFVARTLHVPLFCPFAGNGCDIVQDSPYAVILGIPVSFLGLLGFGAYGMLVVLGLWFGQRTAWPQYCLVALSLLGVAGMAYFSYVELALIHAVCSICVFVAALHVTVATLSIWATSKQQPHAPLADA